MAQILDTVVRNGLWGGVLEGGMVQILDTIVRNVVCMEGSGGGDGSDSRYCHLKCAPERGLCRG